MALQYDENTNTWYDDDTNAGNSDDGTSTISTSTSADNTGNSDNDSNYVATGTTTNTDATNAGGQSGSGLQVGVRTGTADTGYQTLNADGSITYQDPDGSVYTKNPTGTYTTASGTYDPATGTFTDLGGGQNAGITSLINSAKGFFQKKDAQGKPIAGEYDWAKLAGFGAAAYGILGGDKKTTGGYSGTVPNYQATRQQIQYNDPNRRPGAAGRQYFTDTQYSTAAAAPAARTAADTQAQGILANYTPATAPTDKWGVGALKPAVAMPWVKQADTGTASTAGTASAADTTNFMTPEQKLASLQPPVKAATGRYLRGSTDGMADQINTSIDDKQPAKLSHGEFVVPADVVSHLGNGNSDAGAKKLYSMMDKVRQARTGTKKQGKQINPDKYMPGGTVNKYAAGGIAQLPTKKFTGGGTTGPATDTTTSSTLSPWAGDYVTSMLGKGQALTNQPYQAYTGPLTAGASDLQQQQFAGLSGIASTGLTPTQYTTGTFDTTQAQKYMNPYIQTALDPQLKEMQRQADIARLSDAGRLTQAGAYGGSRQAIMESEGRRNLLDKQTQAIGTGYQTAYDKAMAQYNADMGRGLQTQQAQQAANEASANFGLKSLDALGQAGAVQRGIESEGVAADKAQFEEQRDYPYKMVQYQQGLLQGLPITTQSNTQNMSDLTSLLANAGYAGKLQELINSYLNPTASPTSAASSGTTNSASSGTTAR